MPRQGGAILLPLGLVTAFFSVAGIGLWGVMSGWRKTAEIQLRLDSCVAGRALELRDRLTSVGNANLRIKAIRLALVAATLLPEARAALEAALKIQVALQDGQVLGWQWWQGLWLARRGCDGRDYPVGGLPDLPWLGREWPDMLGPQPLREKPGGGSEFYIRLAGARKRFSAALVSRFEKSPQNKGAFNDIVTTNRWRAKWARPGIY